MAEHCANNDPMSGGAGVAAGDSPGLCVSQKIHWPHNVTCYLVKFYRQTPCLWDHSHRDYSDKAAKERALQQFSNETGYPVEAVRKKLINLRNQFTNEWQKMDRSSNSAKAVPHQVGLLQVPHFPQGRRAAKKAQERLACE
ncbi:hypothetical protein HPB49_023274 [Dermacentor silvarum]|uniref:Uncharacterized protein n=1 Tax=Dermacentor silvarum TaxID=543639 RepID=A0ACB8D0Q9_DERSI|nr:hypothetical protein HPB49_023274 [Dermacentor silvarum]